MSNSESEDNREFLIDALGLVVGAIIIIFIASIMTYWSENKDQFYLNNPDFIPGVYITIGILVLFPVWIYGSLIFVKGFWEVAVEIAKKSRASN